MPLLAVIVIVLSCVPTPRPVFGLIWKSACVPGSNQVSHIELVFLDENMFDRIVGLWYK